MAHLKKIIGSPLFTFLIGNERVPVTIHTALVKAQSKPLYAMTTNGYMKQSTTGVATLEDVDLSTFMGFCEFLYGGSYRTPDRMELGEDKESTLLDESFEAKSTRIVKRPREENPELAKLRQIYAQSSCKRGLHGETVDNYLFTNLPAY